MTYSPIFNDAYDPNAFCYDTHIVGERAKDIQRHLHSYYTQTDYAWLQQTAQGIIERAHKARNYRTRQDALKVARFVLEGDYESARLYQGYF